MGAIESAGKSADLSAIPQLNEDEKKAKELREYIKANYTKHEFLIPMRDGVRLFTSVYTPKNRI